MAKMMRSTLAGLTNQTIDRVRRRCRTRLAQRPVQTHRQMTSQGHLGHVPAPPELQPLIFAPQFGIKWNQSFWNAKCCATRGSTVNFDGTLR
ncbi:MAG: hypothetical protein ACRD22_17300, partial [Terriglobia bacterium]